MNKMNVPCKSLGIAVARMMFRGDIRSARILAGMRNSWTPIEVRAILGVGRVLNNRFGITNGISLAKSIMNW